MNLNKMTRVRMMGTLVIAFLVGILIGPSLLNGQLTNPLPPASPADGRYVVSELKAPIVAGDATGALGSLITLMEWEGVNVPSWVRSEKPSQWKDLRLGVPELARRIGLVSACRGDGRALTDLLPKQSVAEVAKPTQRFIAISEVKDGYVFAVDPNVGTVLYPPHLFRRVWTGWICVIKKPRNF